MCYGDWLYVVICVMGVGYMCNGDWLYVVIYVMAIGCMWLYVSWELVICVTRVARMVICVVALIMDNM